MITLHLLKLLEQEGLGTIWDATTAPNGDLFFGDVTLDSQGKPRDGIWIVNRPAPTSARNVKIQQYEIYSRFTNKLTGLKRLEDILFFLENTSQKPCELPDYPPYSSAIYSNVRLEALGSIEDVGTDENGKLVRAISGSIRYNKK